jgi:hypothetical protein
MSINSHILFNQRLFLTFDLRMCKVVNVVVVHSSNVVVHKLSYKGQFLFHLSCKILE